jgi:hypothetical protein
MPAQRGGATFPVGAEDSDRNLQIPQSGECTTGHVALVEPST